MNSSEKNEINPANIPKIKQTAANTVKICNMTRPPLREQAKVNADWNQKYNAIEKRCNEAKENKVLPIPILPLKEIQEGQEEVQNVKRALHEYTLPEYSKNSKDTLPKNSRNTTKGGRRRSRKQKKRRSRKHRSRSRRSRK